MLASRGRMKVVSDKFISLATDCISESVSPLPSGNTASEFPSRTRLENTSHCVTEKRRPCLFISLPGRFELQGKDAERGLRDAESTKAAEFSLANIVAATSLTGLHFF